tara:strand:+ start:820 stop:1038 length:219 start_codon:yes stop_codon:yes gene_type:complete
MITPDIKRIHVVPIDKKDDNSIVKSIKKLKAKNIPTPISINSNIALKNPFLAPRIELKIIKREKRRSMIILR